MTAPIDAPAVPDTRTIRVDTGDLRNALNAVVPHAKKVKTGEDAVEHRIRLVLDKPTTEDRDIWLRILATNGQTTAAALVQVLEDDGAEGLHTTRLHADLLPVNGRVLLALFKSAREGAELSTTEALAVRFRPGDVKVTDVGGLFVGHSILMPQLPFAEGFPDVEQFSLRALAEAATPSTPGRVMVASGQLTSLFKKASDAYSQDLNWEPIGAERGAGWLVTCGRRFVGTVKSDDGEGLGGGRRAQDRVVLLERFGALPAEHEPTELDPAAALGGAPSQTEPAGAH